MTPEVCGHCGFSNPLGANFCSSCGQEISETRTDKTEQLEPTPEPQPLRPVGMFVVRQGPKRGSRISLDSAAVSIGRDSSSDIFLDDITVSRNHASLRRTANGFEVNDSGSMNGTYVNRARVDTAELTDGDEVQIGKFKLVYVELGTQ